MCAVRNQNLNIFILNVRSVRQNFDNTLSLIEATKVNYDVVVLTEVWIKEHETDLYHIPNYYSMLCASKTSSAGGVLVFYSEKLNVIKANAICRVNSETVKIVIKIDKRKMIDVNAVYRSPNKKFSDPRLFIQDELSVICDKSSKDVTDIIFCGDININLIGDCNEKNKNKIRHDYLKALTELGLEQVLDDVTRLESKSCIDHIFMKTNQIKDQKVEVIPRADHCALKLKCTYEVTDLRRTDTKSSVRQVYNEVLFKNLITAHDWSFYFGIQNAEEAANYLVDTFAGYQKQSRHEVKCSKLRRRKLKPWISHGLIAKVRREKHTLKCNAAINRLRKTCRKQKHVYYNSKFKSSKKNPSKQWKLINHDIRGKVKKGFKLSEIPELDEDVNDQEKINKLNHHLATTGKKIAESTQCQANQFQDYLDDMERTYTRFNFLPPSPAEILAAIDNIGKSNATGFDKIFPKFIRSCKDICSLLLEHVFKLCLIQCTYPSVWKISVVTPLHKTKTKSIENLRPISVPPFFAKIFEKVLIGQMQFYFETNQLINERQFGFKKNSCTEDAIVVLQQFVTDALEVKMIPVIVFLDLRKAFDTISKSRLLKKLDKAGFETKSLQFLSSFLNERKQVVKINDLFSEEENVEFGLPQGGILSPLLFNFFINDIHMLEDNSLKLQYADDTALCYTLQDLSDLKLVSHNFSLIKDFLLLNYLSLNVSKTKLLIFRRKGKVDGTITVHQCSDYWDQSCSCPRISNVSDTEYLGTIIQQDMRWNKHTSKVLQKLRTTCATMISIKNMVDEKLLRNIYFSLFESHIRYALLAYGGANKSLLESIFIMQKKAIRIINGLNKRDSTQEYFRKEKILNIYALYLFKLFRFYSVNRELFVDNELKAHETRRNKKLIKCVPLINFDSSCQTPYFRILKIINNVNQNFLCEDYSKDSIAKCRESLLNLNVNTLREMLYN